MLDKVTKDCRDKFFHKFENRCLYDINFLNIAN